MTFIYAQGDCKEDYDSQDYFSTIRRSKNVTQQVWVRRMLIVKRASATI